MSYFPLGGGYLRDSFGVGVVRIIRGGKLCDISVDFDPTPCSKMFSEVVLRESGVFLSRIGFSVS